MTTERLHIHDHHLGSFNTISGLEVNFLQPTEDSIDIEDIAHALSNICRFGGHCFPFYSVAQHSVIVAALAPERLRLAALLHDASEAYLGDVIKPLKTLIATNYTQYEEQFELVIGNKYGVDYADLMAIREYDMRALELEHEALQKKNYAPLLDVMYKNGLLQTTWSWPPPYAYFKFLEVFKELYPINTEETIENVPENTE